MRILSCVGSRERAEKLRRINSAVLPVTYTDAFYRSIFENKDGGTFAWVAFPDDDTETAIGGISVKVQGQEATIATLAVLSDHRRHGVARFLVAAALEKCEGVTNFRVTVQLGNDDAISFYRSVGFSTVGSPPTIIRNYYRRIEFGSHDAIMMVLKK